jgi:hypothetical protein
MIRLALALAVWIGYVTAAPATLAARKDGPLFGNKAAPHFQSAQAPTRALAVVGARAESDDYVVTEQTEVLLNGKPCSYKEVPDNATILRLELGPDNKTVRKIHFRAGNPPSR